MDTLKNPSPKKLAAYLAKHDLHSATILHYTGNMWGIGAMLMAKEAIVRINNLKQRDKAGMIVLIPDQDWFEENDIVVPDRIQALMHQYFPGNLSIAFKVSDPRFEDISVKGKVAFRVPTDPMLRAFLAIKRQAMVSTSINYSSLPAENDLKRILQAFGSWFDLALIPHPKAIAGNLEPSTLVEHGINEESGLEELKCLREGSIPFFEVKKSFNLPQVMFVCTANICRSPIAEHLFRRMVHSAGLSISVDSSGLLDGGHMISISSMQLLVESGIKEASEHVSKRITPQMVSASRLVLTMEERQRDFLQKQNPDSASKIMTLNEITGMDGDIADPFGSDIENYRKTYTIIEERLNTLLTMIKDNVIKI
ncbi:MAG: Sua5/YciO/YrdC/YwlC family protein [Candidatus Cloacimonetes bacterium]|jgi:protein-tyrosine-phosphatase/tRNA A37 threonylcarbamoyladenosine synthetase subunit TsaC/SUA5/YrdC|nr:Sua5/YciO/YrdC/YwlC family protein [Candidatus Cloacimonadota bacterium]